MMEAIPEPDSEGTLGERADVKSDAGELEHDEDQSPQQYRSDERSSEEKYRDEHDETWLEFVDLQQCATGTTSCNREQTPSRDTNESLATSMMPAKCVRSTLKGITGDFKRAGVTLLPHQTATATPVSQPRTIPERFAAQAAAKKKRHREDVEQWTIQTDNDEDLATFIEGRKPKRVYADGSRDKSLSGYETILRTRTISEEKRQWVTRSGAK